MVDAHDRPDRGVRCRPDRIDERHVELLDSLLARCEFPSSDELICGVSGGPDSLALLVLACWSGRRAQAVHVDHGLRPGSDREFALVQTVATEWGASARSVTLHLDDGPNLEARARAARREVLPVGTLLGHTADDRAEWVLLALIRGAGLDGVASMDAHVRPLLRLRSSETRQLCSELGLRVLDDPHNLDDRFRRVRVRREVLPLLDDIAARDTAPLLDRFASLAAEDVALLDELAAALDPTDCIALAAAPRPLARRAVRSWLRADHPIDAAATERVMEVVTGHRIATELPGGRRVSRSRQRLRLEPAPADDAESAPAADADS